MWYRCAGTDLFLEKDMAKFLTEHGAICEEIEGQGDFKPNLVSIAMEQAQMWWRKFFRSEDLIKFL